MFRSILLAIDFDDRASADRTAEAACRPARLAAAEGQVLTVQPSMGMPMVDAYDEPAFACGAFSHLGPPRHWQTP